MPPPTFDQTPVNDAIDAFHYEIQGLFKCYLLASVSYKFGSATVDQVTSGNITAIVGVGVEIEPIPIEEVKQFRLAYPDFIAEVFQGKMILCWHKLLVEIFSYYIKLHFDGVRPFVELKKTQTRIDFTDLSPLNHKIADSLIRDFDFLPYADRFRLINKLRSTGGDATGSFATILRMHVQIRNAFQHHHGVVSEDLLADLGVSQLNLLNDLGQEVVFPAGSKIKLTDAEIYRLKQTLIALVQTWKS